MKDGDYMILDIKPGNILNKYVDGIIHCMFSDYGTCGRSDDTPMVIRNLDYTKIYMLDSEFLESMKTKNIAFFQFAATLIDLIDYSTDEQPPQFLSKKLRPYQTIPYVVINQSRSAENLCRIVKPSLEKTNQLFVYLYDMITLLEDSYMTIIYVFSIGDKT